MTDSDKRHFIRRDSLHLLDYVVFDPDGIPGEHSMGRTLDVSENGIKLETTQNIEMGDSLVITVGLEDDLVDLKGKVVFGANVGDRFHSGVEFIEITDEGRRVFKLYTEAFKKQFNK